MVPGPSFARAILVRDQNLPPKLGPGPKFAVKKWSRVVNFGPVHTGLYKHLLNLVQDQNWLAKFGPGPKLAS